MDNKHKAPCQQLLRSTASQTRIALTPRQVHLALIGQMKIASQPIPSIPAYVKEQAVSLPPAVGGSASRTNYRPLGGPAGSVAIYGLQKPFSFETAKEDHKKLVLSLLRFVSKPIADQIGHQAALINNSIWLCIDFKALRERIRAAGTDKTQHIIDATAFVSDLAGTVALVPQLEGAEKVADICKFFALSGEQAHKGGVACNGADINKFMAEFGGDETRQKLLEIIDELCEER